MMPEATCAAYARGTFTKALGIAAIVASALLCSSCRSSARRVDSGVSRPALPSPGAATNDAPSMQTAQFLSHPPLRELPKPVDRAMGKGKARFVDATNGNDTGEGTKKAPWKTIKHALGQVEAGQTLYLRGGTYYEHVYCGATGTEKKPITIRSYPGELATIDGGLREFFEAPSLAWEPFPKGADGEFRSTRAYRNLRNLHGRFGDSMIGLQVYYYAEDLRGKPYVDRTQTERYVGPGVWYDRTSGYIHARLGHYERKAPPRGKPKTDRPQVPSVLYEPQSYKGDTDPRKLPLIIAPFRSIPLFIDRASHVRFQDLVVRGGGYDAVQIHYGRHLEFDNVVIYAGTYGLKARNTGPLKFHNSAIYGSVPPWSTRGETSLREYPWREGARDLTRLSTHALLVPVCGDEYSVYYYPYNNRWEISYSEFADGHDAVYLGDMDGLSFHHNLVHANQDDGVYLSCFRGLHKPQHGPRQIYQNVIVGGIMTFAYGGNAKLTGDVHVYRNILDGSAVVADHGGPPWEGMRWYHNTVLSNPRNLFNLRHTKPGQTWQVFNNIVLTGKAEIGKPQEGAAAAGNFSGDPKFVRPGKFQLQADSPAIDAGEAIPEDWPDPLRDQEKGKPDAGAIPAGSEPLKVGPFGRYEF